MRHLRRSILFLVLLAIAFGGRALLARRLGTITGTVTEAGSGIPLASAQVRFFNELGVEQFPAATTAVDGTYSKSLPAGTYYVRTGNTPTHVDELHSGIQCHSFCDPVDGTPVFLADLDALVIDFALDQGTSISGTVTGTGGAGLEGVNVDILDAGNQTLAGITTDASGAWATPGDLPAGSYFVRTRITSFAPAAVLGYVPELYDNIPCLTSPCSFASATQVTTTVATPATGVTLALDEGGYFEGTVTSDGITGQAGVIVDVLNMAGQRVAFSGTTTASGAYRTVPGLPPGAYVLRTQNTAGRINAFNDGSLCVGTTCSVTNETPIQILGPGAIPGVNFTLPAGAQIVGTLLGNGVINLGLSLSVLTSSGTLVSFANVDGTGTYRSRDGVPPGTYYLRTSNSQGFLNELSGGVTCAPSCTLTSGTPVTVTTTGDVTGPDFDLAPGGRVSGVVRSSAPGNPPVGGATVTVVNAAGAIQASGFTSANGAYTTDAGLLTGSDYRIITSNQSGMINRVYPTTPCEGTICNAAVGDPISVTEGAVPTNVNITLDPGGRFTGFVLGSGSPIAGAGVQVLNAGGQTIVTGNTDALGKYLTSAGLQTGSYKIRTTNSLGFVNELYDNVECGPSCNLAAGTPVGTTAGLPPAGPFSFDLAQGGRISGSVKDAGLTPLIGVNVSVFNPTTGTSVSGLTDGAGVFSIGGLAPGTYYARTSNSIGFINEAYDGGAGIPCVFSCNSLTLGAPLVIAGATDLTGIDFVLDAGARIAGFIQEDGGVPLQGVSVSIVDAGGQTHSNAVTDAFGNYLTGVGLRPGTYFVRTSNSLGYLNEVYDNLPCTIPCSLSGATGVAVAGSATTGGINFGLAKGGRVTGTVVDATTLLPLVGINVGIADSSGRTIATGNTDASGTFISGAGLPSGTYYARTNNSQGYQDEIYDDVKCPSSCAVVAGASFVVTVGSTTSGINFALDKGWRVSGIVTSDSAAPLAGVTVQIYDSTGKFFTSGFTNSFGLYTTSAGVPAGTYYARTQNGIGYINELYGGAQCLGNCLVTTGTSFAFAGPPGTHTGIDFQLTEGGRISGVITDGVTPLSGIGVTIFDSTGVFVTSATTNGVGSYTSTSGLPAGNYFVRTANNKGYVNQLWNVGNCLGCDVTTGTMVAVALGSTTGGIDFTLTAGGRIGGTITRSDTSAGVPGALATIHNASGLRVATGVADANGVYLTNEGLPDDTYFVRTENSAGLVNQIYLGLPCSTACDPTTGTGVVTTAPGTTGGIDFVLTPDADADADGIVNTIDLSLVFSNDFSDVAQGGSTDGTIVARGGFTVSVGDVLGGVQISLSGAGTSADIDTCATGGLERVTLDVAGETAAVACQPITGSSFVRAIVASPTIEVRDPPTGGGTVALLTTGQAVTMGSPVTADPTNDEVIVVKIVDSAGNEIGSFSLDPGESAEAIVSPAGAVDVTVVVGTVTVTVRGEDVTLDSGESHDFPPVTFTFTGFFNPVSNTALNPAKAGSSVPLKFSLGSDAGLNIFAAGFPQSQQVDCTTGAPIGLVEATVGTLQYDPVSGRYSYHWRTQKAWAGTCRQLTMTFIDAAATTATARFQFK